MTTETQTKFIIMSFSLQSGSVSYPKSETFDDYDDAYDHILTKLPPGIYQINKIFIVTNK